jgi:hypothetical protein
MAIPVEPATILDAENFAAIGAFICSLAGQNYSEPLKAFALFDQKHIRFAKWTRQGVKSLIAAMNLSRLIFRKRVRNDVSIPVS